MRKALYVEEEIFFTGYLHLFCEGRPENYVDLCPKIWQGTLSLTLRQIV